METSENVLRDNQENKNQIQFERIVDKLRAARKAEPPDVDLHLQALSQLIENQDLILKTCNFERIEFEFFYDLIYDYGQTICHQRDEVLICKSALRWLSCPETGNQREQFTHEIMKLINFDQMKAHELRQVFSFLDTYPLSGLLKDYLHKMQRQMIASHRIDFESLFVDCFKI